MEDQDTSINNKKITQIHTEIVCGVPNCTVTSNTKPGYKLYRLPADKERRQLWLRKIQHIKNSSKLYVCERHFNSNHLSPRKQLRKVAVPMYHLPPDNEQYSAGVSSHSGEAMDIEETTILGDESDTSTLDAEPIIGDVASTSTNFVDAPVKLELSETFDCAQGHKVVQIKEEKNSLTVFVDEDKEDDDQENLVGDQSVDGATQNKTELRNKTKKQKFSYEYNMFALRLYFKSPNAYRLLQPSFTLPRISTIYRLCIPKTPGICEDVMRALSLKAACMTKEQKQAVVCTGIMSLSSTLEYDAVTDRVVGFHKLNGVETMEPVTHAIFVVVRGLFHNWKQTIAYSFIASPEKYNYHINLFIKKIIKRLLDIGLRVRVLMSDMEIDFVTTVKEPPKLALSVKDPFFFVNGIRIHFMYDPLHLMRLLRDTFMNHNITFGNGLCAKWTHVEVCYEYDSKMKNLRLAPKLSHLHVKPLMGGVRDNLTMTSELLSETTATAISTCIDLDVLEHDAKDTVQWILILSRLLNMLNFSTKYPPVDRKDVFSGEQAQVDFLLEMLQVLRGLRLSNDVTQFLIHKKCFLLTINSLLLLHRTLQTESATSRVIGLSNDCLDDFLQEVFKRHGAQPTTQQMTMCIKTIPAFNMFRYTLNKRTNGELKVFLSLAKQAPDVQMYEEQVSESYVDLCAGATADFPAIEASEENSIEHLASYLLVKGSEKHSDCVAMKNYVFSKDNTLGNKQNMVDSEFITFLMQLQAKFDEYFKEFVFSKSLQELQTLAKDVTFDMPCECFPLEFIKQLYFRFLLYCHLKYEINAK